MAPKAFGVASDFYIAEEAWVSTRDLQELQRSGLS